MLNIDYWDLLIEFVKNSNSLLELKHDGKVWHMMVATDSWREDSIGVTLDEATEEMVKLINTAY